jgi:hypothetical protein
LSKATCKASVDVIQNNPSLKGECNWEFKGGRMATQVSMQERFGDRLGGLLFAAWDGIGLSQIQAFNPATFDASLLRMNTAGSTAALEDPSGTFTVKLYNGTQLLSASSFVWIRSGSNLRPADPGALNAWVGQYPSADGFEYGGTVRFDARQAQSAAIYGVHSYNGSVAYSTTNSIARPGRNSGPGFTAEQ